MDQQASSKALDTGGISGRIATLFRRFDAWSSTVLGIGTAARDKTVDASFAHSPVLDDAQLAALYDCNFLVSRVVDLVPDEALREGFGLTIQADEGSDAGARAAVTSKVLTRCGELGVANAVTIAHKWARALRGGAILLDVDDGQETTEGLPDRTKPLDEKAVKSVRALRVITRTELTIAEVYADPRHPKWGEPAVYQWTARVQGAMGAPMQRVHESRLVVIDGKLVTPDRRAQYQGWGAAEVDRIFELARDFGLSWAAVANLMQVSSQAVYKMRGLIEAVSEGESATLEERMRLTELWRSVSRALLLDAGDENGVGEESFELHSVQWGGVADLLDRWMALVSAATGIPITVLFGRSPAGLNATGESDSQTWEKLVRAEQTRVTRPALERILRVIFLAQDGPTGAVEPAQWEVSFGPLRIPTPTEQAGLRKAVADTDAVYVNMGVLLPEEVAVNRFRAEGWNPDTQVDLEARRALLESDKAIRAGEAAPPEAEPPPPPAEATEPARPEDAKDPSTALNAGQISEMRETILAVAVGDLPREVGVQILASAFPFDLPTAERIMGEVGRSFSKPKPVPPPSPFAGSGGVQPKQPGQGPEGADSEGADASKAEKPPPPAQERAGDAESEADDDEDGDAPEPPGGAPAQRGDGSLQDAYGGVTIALRPDPPFQLSRVRLDAADEEPSGAMVALFLPPAVARRYVIPNGVPAADMHVTLAYLGTADRLLPSAVEALRVLLRDLVRHHAERAPLVATISGVGTFAPTDSSDGARVDYLSVDAPWLPMFREAVIRACYAAGCTPSARHGFTPHVSLSYGGETLMALPEPEPVTFEGLTLAVGGAREFFPIGRFRS